MGFGLRGSLAIALFLCLGFGCKAPDRGSGSPGAGGGGGDVGSGGHGGGSGGSGSGGASGSGGQVDAGPSRGPAPPIPGHKFPFPQNRQSSGCVYPQGYLNEDVQAAYAKWKSDTVVADSDSGGFRVQRPNEHNLDANSTVSEGIGYGMLIAVYMDDQALFDGLWKYEQKHLETSPPVPAANGLMNWYILANGQVGTTPPGTGGATDADEDMAFALLMADKQWGGQGTLPKSYLQNATDLIGAIWNHEVIMSKLIAGGDQFPPDFSEINISYFAPAYYRLFKTVYTPPNNGSWDDVINTVYDTITIALNNVSQQQANGLVPAWCAASGSPPTGKCAPGVPGRPGNYQYDSCRTPFRIALDWCWNGEPRAQAYLAKTSAFFSAKGAANITDGYGLDGTPQPQFGVSEGSGMQSAAFVGPAGVGAMSSATYQSFVNDAYADVAKLNLLIGGTYYDDSWTVMSLLMMTGNFLNYTAY
jgi:endo-1,4-beta-D-glucanase Y